MLDQLVGGVGAKRFPCEFNSPVLPAVVHSSLRVSTGSYRRLRAPGGARLLVTPRRRSLEVSQSFSARSASQPEPVCRHGVNRDRTLPFRILAYAPLPK